MRLASIGYLQVGFYGALSLMGSPSHASECIARAGLIVGVVVVTLGLGLEYLDRRRDAAKKEAKVK